MSHVFETALNLQGYTVGHNGGGRCCQAYKERTIESRHVATKVATRKKEWGGACFVHLFRATAIVNMLGTVK